MELTQEILDRIDAAAIKNGLTDESVAWVKDVVGPGDGNMSPEYVCKIAAIRQDDPKLYELTKGLTLNPDLMKRIHDDVYEAAELFTALMDVVKTDLRVNGGFDISRCYKAFVDVLKAYADHLGADFNANPLETVEEVLAGLFNAYSLIGALKLPVS